MTNQTNAEGGGKPTVHLYNLRHWKGARCDFAVIGEEAESGDVDGFALAKAWAVLDRHGFASKPRRVKSLHSAAGWFEVTCGALDAPGIERKQIILHDKEIAGPSSAATVDGRTIGVIQHYDIEEAHRPPENSISVSDIGGHGIPAALAAVEAGFDAKATTSLAISAEIVFAIDPANPRWTEKGTNVHLFDKNLSSLGILTASTRFPDGRRKGPGAGIVQAMSDAKAMEAAAAWVQAAKDTPHIFWDMVSLFADDMTIRRMDLDRPTGHRRMKILGAIERLEPFAAAYLQALPSGHRTEDFLLGVRDHLNRCHDGRA